MDKKAILLFPPNWSACTNGPHLALPLLAGAGRKIADWHIQSWDLNEDYYHQHSTPPVHSGLLRISQRQDFAALDDIYFEWEDSLKMFCSGDRLGDDFSLLSGYSFAELSGIKNLRDIETKVSSMGTVYSRFYKERVIPAVLKEEPPAVIGLTISSLNQLVPSVELLRLLKQCVPEAFLVVGGNVVSRLRESSALQVLMELSDQVILFQGEKAICDILQAVGNLGAERAKQILPKIAGDQSIPCNDWPIPSFAGIRFERSIGLPVLPYVSTRGCYWGRCHFCAIPAGWASSGYGGSASSELVVGQLRRIIEETGIPRIKFVDESMSPNKVSEMCGFITREKLHFEWEAYARLEPAWENISFLETAQKCGLRKLYLGLEQAPSSSRVLFGKQDGGDPSRILRACHQAGINVHFFCMVGYPGTSREDAELTVRFLLDNQSTIDTADLVGFRLDRGTTVPGVRPCPNEMGDWTLSVPYKPAEDGVLTQKEVVELEGVCQEILWEEAPRLLHPLYRVIGNWEDKLIIGESNVHDSHSVLAYSAN